MFKLIVPVSGQEVQIEVFSQEDGKVPNSIALPVADPSDHKAIQALAAEALIRLNWHLDPRFRHLTLREKFELYIGGEKPVMLYNFMRTKVPSETLKAISMALRFMRLSLHHRKFWCLDTIQLMPDDEQNTKNGEPLLGRECTAQNRFELFPATFRANRYDNPPFCTGLEAVCWHEATHICLEDTLAKMWNDYRDQLGWSMVPEGINIVLPGGSIQRSVQLYPEQCPTAYAALQENDDRADSVVAALSGQPLSRWRAEFVGCVLDTEGVRARLEHQRGSGFKALPPTLFHIRVRRPFRLIPPAEACFVPVRRQPVAKPGPMRTLTPAEYRREFLSR